MKRGTTMPARPCHIGAHTISRHTREPTAGKCQYRPKPLWYGTRYKTHPSMYTAVAEHPDVKPAES